MNRQGEIFAAYVAEMQKSKKLAESWWTELLTREAARQGDERRGREQVTDRWPFGPASHPFVLATYRKYFLQCAELNRQLEAEEDERGEEEDDDDDWGRDDDDDEESDDLFEGPDQPMSGFALLIETLPGRQPELAKFLAWMVYAPIGLDDEDENV